MRQTAWITVFLLLFHPSVFAGAKEEEQPDREMLRIMELLEKWEIINNLELMRQVDTLEGVEEISTEPGLQRSPREEKDRQR